LEAAGYYRDLAAFGMQPLREQEFLGIGKASADGGPAVIFLLFTALACSLLLCIC
jgi:hypothetical protein